MKTTRMSWYFTVLIALSFAALARTSYFSQPVAHISLSLRPADLVNPIRVDNYPLAYQRLSTASRSLLTVVSAGPASERSARIPFRIYLRQNGYIVPNDTHKEDQSVTEIDLNAVLDVARPGDWLSIEPVRKEDSVIRQTLLLKSPVYPWLLFAGKQGC